MTYSILPVLPLVIMAGGLSAGLIVIAAGAGLASVFTIALLSILASGASIFVSASHVPAQAGLLFYADSFALFFSGLLLFAGACVAVFASGYLKGRQTRQEEFYLLLLGALTGALALVFSRHFASFFLGLEVLSVSLYGLIAYPRSRQVHTEAAIKYLIVSGASSALLLYGMALVYGLTGTMEFGPLGRVLGAVAEGRVMATAGMVLIVLGLGFKLAVVPFHMWAPDVYEGAPAPVAAFIATVSKGAVFALLFRYFADVALSHLSAVFVVIAVASMLAGNLLALFQDNIKRLLAYSSIAHLGYLLVAFIASGPLRTAAVAFYLAAYFVTTLGAFGVVTVLSGNERDADRIEDYEGLFYRRPWLAGAFTLQLLSLAGMPLTAGFIGKVYLVAAGVGSSLRLPVAALIVGSAIGLFYYLRVIAAVYRRPAPGREGLPDGPRAGLAVIGLLVALMIWWGVYPGPLLDLIGLVRLGP